MPAPEPGAKVVGIDAGEAVPTAENSDSTGASETTVGTGSALGIGCLVAVIVLVLIAFAVRWLTGIW